jgi:predicted type IV restriction endonuclease
MATISNKVKDRLAVGLKRFQPILAAAKDRDVNESDTVTIIKDVLAEMFGYDKYTEITSEYAIRGTYADLAIKLDGVLQMLIEVKAIGLELKDSHTKQAVDYAANEGKEWVALTNGDNWHVYRITFGKPIGQELVFEFDFLSLSHKNANDIERLYLLTKEGWAKSVLGDYHKQMQVLNRYSIAATILTDPVLDVIRRELRRVASDVKVETETIQEVLVQEVLKREVVEGERADEAKRKIYRAQSRALKQAGKEDEKPAAKKAAEPPAPAEPTQE